MWITIFLCLLLLLPAWAQAQVSSFANRNLEQFLTTGTVNSLAQNEDTAHVSGRPGIMFLCVRNDAATVLAGTTLDYLPCTTNASGQIFVVLPAGAAATQVQGTADDGAAEVGNPVQIGGVDAGGLMQAVLVGTDGRFDVNVGQWAGATATGGAGAVAAGTPRMTLASNDPAVVALQILDDIVATDRAKVNPIVGQAGVAAGVGLVDGGTQRMTLAGDDPAVTALQIMDDWDETNRAAVNLIAGQVAVAGGTGVDAANVLRMSLATNVPLPAGTAIIGALSANQSVNVAQVAGTATSVNAGVLDAGVQRVTIATNDEVNDDLDSIRIAVELLDNISHTGDVAVTGYAAIGAVFDDVGPVAVTENQAQSLRMSSRRELYSQIRDAAGNERGTNVNASNELNVSAAVTSFPDNEPFNVAQFGGSAVVTGTGAGGAGIPRVTISNDSSLAANQSVNVAQINGVAPLMGAGVTGTGSPRISISTDANNVDVERAPAAATVDTSFTGQTADFDLEAAATNLRLTGWSVREDAGTAAPATVVLRHGVLSGGNCTATAVFAFIELGPDQSVSMSYGTRGLAGASGICADILAGSVSAVVFTVVEAAP